MITLSTEEEMIYLHFLFCIESFQRAKNTLETIQNHQGHPLCASAFGYALIQYSQPYSKSRSTRTLSTKYIPKQYLDLHSQLLRERNQIHAHSDHTLINPKIWDINKTDGVMYLLMSRNVDLRFEKMSKIFEILILIDKTLENMYQDKFEREAKILEEMGEH